MSPFAPSSTADATPARPEPIPHERVELGSVLVSLLEPERGAEVELHRWYERDHFYAGCMALPYYFSGRRYVATRALKALRFPEDTPVLEHARHGSYLALYWMLAGHHEDAVARSVSQVHWLAEHGRMSAQRAQSHAGFYHRRFAVRRDEDGVPPELALEHPFPTIVLLMSDREESVPADAFEARLEANAGESLRGGPAALCIGLAPEPLPDDAPAYVRRPPGLERRMLEIFFLDCGPEALADGVWDERFRAHDAWLRAEGLGRVSLAAPFVPTIPGTDRYADELW